MSCTQPFDLGTSRVAWPLTLPVMLTSRPGFPVWSANTKGPFHRRRTNVAASQTQSAFRLRVPSTPPPARAGSEGRGRRWYLGFAASAQCPTRVHAQVVRARPNPLAGYSPELLGHVPLVDFCN
jgi:hypothetical protein